MDMILSRPILRVRGEGEGGSELSDSLMGDGNSFGECIVASLHRLVSSRKTRTHSSMDITQRYWEYGFLSAAS
jgi:hypothetical protein